MEYRDPEWVAEKLGLERNTVYRMLQEGTLPAVQLGRKWLISEERLGQWLEEETERQTQARRQARESTRRVVRRLDQYTAEAREVIREGHTLARGMNHLQLGVEHLLMAMLGRSGGAAGRVLQKAGVDAGRLREAIGSRMTPGDAAVPRRLGRTPQAKRATRLAQRELPGQDGVNVSEAGLLMGLVMAAEGWVADVLRSAGVSPDLVRRALAEAAPGEVRA